MYTHLNQVILYTEHSTSFQLTLEESVTFCSNMSISRNFQCCMIQLCINIYTRTANQQGCITILGCVGTLSSFLPICFCTGCRKLPFTTPKLLYTRTKGACGCVCGHRICSLLKGSYTICVLWFHAFCRIIWIPCHCAHTPPHRLPLFWCTAFCERFPTSCAKIGSHYYRQHLNHS